MNEWFNKTGWGSRVVVAAPARLLGMPGQGADVVPEVQQAVACSSRVLSGALGSEGKKESSSRDQDQAGETCQGAQQPCRGSGYCGS